LTGAEYIAQTLKDYGVSHVFYVEAIQRRTLVEMEKLGIRRVLTHSEKAAAFMADGAAGLQDAFLGHPPVIAFTGRKPPLYQYRNAYQEILHDTICPAVT
jgi:acetolactate synthase-1/2/3 large subunit